uniref:Uncharacterized protein n=1 Tax=Siphovirus contig89 TaxID=1518022 RepID=A0A075EHT8_9CAUD|nr:hypothetical protein [Siphovirus contig89]AIE38426.1 hypothetical protein [Siphovirus contig89]AIE38469.1 hypothetical protein [Siphovirus contig89]AIE38512.1 hypothetical protein [Siphovirus contig89]AIE38555.1 hypothetical protein [Siphovirus contig89]
MLVPVVLSDWYSENIPQRPQHEELIVEIIEDDSPRMLLTQLPHSLKSHRILIRHPSQDMTEASCVLDGLFLVRIEAILLNRTIWLLLVGYRDVRPPLGRLLDERHVYEDLLTKPQQLPLPKISLKTRITSPVVELAVLPLELGAVLEEAVGDKYRAVVHPVITRRARQHDPLVLTSHLDKCLGPFAATDGSLFIEYDEGVTDVAVVTDVVPRIDRRVVRQPIHRDIPLPIEIIPLASSGDYI